MFQLFTQTPPLSLSLLSFLYFLLLVLVSVVSNRLLNPLPFLLNLHLIFKHQPNLTEMK